MAKQKSLSQLKREVERKRLELALVTLEAEIKLTRHKFRKLLK